MSEIQPIIMPKWGLAMEEGTLTAWLVQDRSQIEKGQEIAEIETTKIANVFESPASGTLRRIVVKPGEVVPVGALLAVLAPASVPNSEIDGFVAGFVVEASTDAEAAAGSIAERRMERQGRTLAYKTAGAQSAATPVVLIHGFGGNSDNWLFNIEEIAKDRPVYALDLPGHGKSTKSLAAGDLSELADAVVNLLDEVGAAKAHLVGHSLGAAVAFRVLADRPERVASIVGIGPAGLDDRIRPDYVDGLIAAEKRKDVKAALQLLFADPGLVSAQMVEGVQRFKRLEGAAQALRTIGERNLPSGRQTATFRDLIAEERVPTLIIWGDRDAILDPAAAEGLPSSIEVIRVQNVGHMPHMEAASTVNRHLARHFEAVDHRSPSGV